MRPLRASKALAFALAIAAISLMCASPVMSVIGGIQNSASPSPSSPTSILPPSVGPTGFQTPNTVVATITTGGSPTAIAYDSGTGAIYVTLTNTTGWYDVITASTNAIAHGPIALTNAGDGVLYDSGTSQVYISAQNSHDLPYISDSSPTTIAGTVTTSYNSGAFAPHGLAYVTGTHLIVVPDHGGADAYLLNDQNYTIYNPIVLGIGYDPISGVFDSGKDEVFLSDYGSSKVSIISMSSDTVVGNVSVGSEPYGITYDPSAGRSSLRTEDPIRYRSSRIPLTPS